MTTPARNRRQNQEIPSTATAAAQRFKCEAYLITMDGERCRDTHVHAAKFKPMNRDACIDCPAGAARAILLGSGVGEAGQPAICTARTVKGLPCAHPPVEGGLCHIHRGAAAGSTPRAHAARKETRMRKKAAEKKPAPAKAKTPRPAPLTSARPAAPKTPAPAVVVADAAVPSAAPTPVTPATPVTPVTPVTCKRSGCERPAMGIGRLPEHCRWCRDSADMTVRKRVGRAGTVAELIEWLNRVPVHKHFRHPSGGAAAQVVPAAAPAPVEAPVPDVHVAVSPEAVDAVFAAAHTTDVPEPERESLTEQRFAELIAEGEELRRAFDKRTEGARVPPFVPVETEPAAPTTDAPGEPVTPVCAPEPPAGNAKRTAPAFRLPRLPGETEANRALSEKLFVKFARRVALAKACATPTARPPEQPPAPAQAEVDAILRESPTESPVVIVALNRRAFAELERMAAAGLHGDDPCDVARTLVLDGLRRWALVRP